MRRSCSRKRVGQEGSGYGDFPRTAESRYRLWNQLSGVHTLFLGEIVGPIVLLRSVTSHLSTASVRTVPGTIALTLMRFGARFLER